MGVSETAAGTENWSMWPQGFDGCCNRVGFVSEVELVSEDSISCPLYNGCSSLLGQGGGGRCSGSGSGELRARPLLHGLMGRKEQLGLMETNYPAIRVVRAEAAVLR